MDPYPQTLSPSEADRTLARLKREFVERFVEALPLPTIQGRAPRAAYWLDPAGGLNHVRVDSYMRPNPMDCARPFITRISVNHFRVDHRDAKLRRLNPRWSGQECFGSPDWRFEFSTLPDELVDFAPWVASLVIAHVRSDADLVAAAPHPCRFWKFEGPEILLCDYAWTNTAWDIVTIYEKRRAAVRAARAARARA